VHLRNFIGSLHRNRPVRKNTIEINGISSIVARVAVI